MRAVEARDRTKTYVSCPTPLGSAAMASNTPPAPNPLLVFDRAAHRARQERRLRSATDAGFLKQLACDDIALRLSAINRRFERVLDLGAHRGELARTLRAHPDSRDKIGEIVSFAPVGTGTAPYPLIAGDEEALPFAEASFDLVVSALALHWVNDLPGALIQARRVLKPDGFFLALLPGAGTLSELRESLLAAETEIRGGAASRVSPFLDLQDGARLMQRAGFAMPVADVDRHVVGYRDPARLLDDLRSMGETAAFHRDQRPPLSRRILARAMAIYRSKFADAEGRSTATFNFVALSGWAPAPTQQQPLKPGSAKQRLADALGVKEQSLEEKARSKLED